MTSPGDAAGEVSEQSLWRNRDFNLLWVSQTLSDLGSFTSMLAVPLLVLATTGSALQAGMVETLALLIRVLTRLPGGALADRWNRRAMMLAADFVRMSLYAALAAAVIVDRTSLALIILVTGGAAFFDMIFSPAETAAISKLVPAPQLPDAFARNEARAYGASLAGMPLGGLLYGITRAVPFIFDAISFLASFLAILTIRRPMQDDRVDPSGNLFADIGYGLRYVLNNSFLRTLLLVAAPLNFAATGALFVLTVSLRQHGVSASLIGVGQGVVAAGGLLGAFTAPWLQRKASLRALVIFTSLALLACLAVASVLTGHFVMVVPLAAGLFLAPAANAALFGRLAATTPDELQGRVISVVAFAATTAAAVSPVAMGALIERISDVAGMGLCTLAIALSGVIAISSRGLDN